MNVQLSRSSEEIRRRFFALRTLTDLADLLEVRPDQLTHYAYGRGRRYRDFAVTKRRGGERHLSEPVGGLKVLQQKINQILQIVYRPRASVHGFVQSRSIATNAAVHAGSTWVLNVDLQDFFPAIHFGRVRGTLMKGPYRLPANVATVFAQICCRHINGNNVLPQGAPSSPTLSNMVCASLDETLEQLARRYGCRYTRYADDLTFSTGRATFPIALGFIDREADPPASRVGDILNAAIEANDFAVQALKVRLSPRQRRQQVTGLVVNDFPNVPRAFRSRLRAMMHAWRRYSHDSAQDEFARLYDAKDRRPGAEPPKFARVVKGHIDYIGMVRGLDSVIYEHHIEAYGRLDSSFTPRELYRRRRNHLTSEEDAIWVVEITDPFMSQGTAFELEGVGLVTCAHVVLDDRGFPLGRDLVVYQPRAGRRVPEYAKVRAFVREIDMHNDVALLTIREQPCAPPLRPKYHPPLRHGSRLRVSGWPQHADGNSLYLADGSVTGIWRHVGSERFRVDFPIVSGASGAPVFDESGSVVGIASQGEDTFERAVLGVTINFGVIPIEIARRLHEANLANEARARAADAASPPLVPTGLVIAGE